MHSTVKLSRNAEYCLNLVKKEVPFKKQLRKIAATIFFFRLIRPTFYVVSKKVIFTSVRYIHWSKNAFKMHSAYTLTTNTTTTNSRYIHNSTRVKVDKFTCSTFHLFASLATRKKVGGPDINCCRN